ncbi:replication protein P [Rodentibacter pneumotropicus]|uniref:replication protein P n=1 Tax=Rodentibacter pneumotropicus TaxID=758 RepID=UPI00109C4221|nr:replication protein P [Rodentibacter pneumotropicus]TGZ98543.1 replication P [Rodentibacter pneumotropicus]
MNAITPTQKSAVEKSDVSGNAAKLIDRMFTRLKSLFPAWKQAFDSIETYNETKQVWLEELIKADVMTPLALKRGLDRAAGSESPFFPSVGQFIAWCSEDYHALGLPNETELYQRYLSFLGYARFNQAEFEYRSKVEYWLLKNLYEKCRKKSEEDTLKAIPKLLTEAAEKVRSNFPFEEIPKGIPEQPSFYDKDRANQARDRLMAEVRGAMQ